MYVCVCVCVCVFSKVQSGHKTCMRYVCVHACVRVRDSEAIAMYVLSTEIWYVRSSEICTVVC
jgi:hypothetical protein